MKNFKWYEEKAKKELYEALNEGLKTGPVRIAVDLEVKSIEDVGKTSHRGTIRRLIKKNAKASMDKERIPSLWMIQPVKNAEFNGIKLDEGIVLPVFAPEILDTNEIKEDYFLMGLFLILQKSYDSYYLKLLKSFEIDRDIAVPELLEMLDGKYWKKRKIPMKNKK